MPDCNDPDCEFHHPEMVEYTCGKCGMWFLDTALETTHYRMVDNDGIDHGECGGTGIPEYTFSPGFSNFGPRKEN